MSYRVDRSRQFGTLGDSPTMNFRRNPSADRTARALEAEQKNDVDAAIITRSERVYDRPRAVSLALRTAETLQGALEAIEATRSEQLRVATEGSTLAQSSRLTTLATQSAALDNEIVRIKSAGVAPNGATVLSNNDTTLSVDDYSTDLNRTYILADSKSFSSPLGVTLATPSVALSDKTLLERNLNNLRAFTAGIAGAAEMISDTIQPRDAVKTVARAVREANEGGFLLDTGAYAAAAAITLADPFPNQKTNQLLIEASGPGVPPKDENSS